MPALDRWVIQHIVRMIDGYGRKLSRLGLTILLNVSPQAVIDVDFAHFLGAQLRPVGIAEQVLIEIPERAAVALAGSSADGRLLGSFRDSGCRFCIDGVGPDLKRLAALQRLPIGLMKIDGDLIRSALANSRAEVAVRSVVEFARAAGIPTAAKCVETMAMAKQLRTLGVEVGQGYAFGPAEPFEHVARHPPAVAMFPWA